jgi:hypothetical protein
MWHFGFKDSTTGACIVRPLRFLEASHFDKSLPSFKSVKTSISKAKGVMVMLRKKAVSGECGEGMFGEGRVKAG